MGVVVYKKRGQYSYTSCRFPAGNRHGESEADNIMQTNGKKLVATAKEFGIPEGHIADFCGYIDSSVKRHKSRFRAVTEASTPKGDRLFKDQDPLFRVIGMVWLLRLYSESGFHSRGNCLLVELEKKQRLLDDEKGLLLGKVLESARAVLRERAREHDVRRFGPNREEVRLPLRHYPPDTD